jgi:hypothetical protein
VKGRSFAPQHLRCCSPIRSERVASCRVHYEGAKVRRRRHVIATLHAGPPQGIATHFLAQPVCYRDIPMSLRTKAYNSHFLYPQIVSSSKNCLSACVCGYRAIIRCQLCPVKLRLTRRSASTLQHSGALSSSTFNLANCWVASTTNPTAKISTLCAREPPCAIDSLSLLRGSEAPFYRSRI